MHQARHLKSENANIIWFNLYQRFRLENQIVKMPYMTKRGKGDRQLPRLFNIRLDKALTTMTNERTYDGRQVIREITIVFSKMYK